MKGIILCAGKGTRLKPITDSVPKTLLPVANKTILDRALDQLAEAGINETAVVINPSQSQIKKHLNRFHAHRNVSVIVQHEALGILHALFQIRSFVGDDDFVVLLGDNVFNGSLSSLIQCFQGHRASIFLAMVNNPQEFGVAEVVNDQIISLEEKPAHPKSNLAIIGIYVFSPAIFLTENVVSPSSRGEYEITDALQWLLDNGHSMSYTVTKEWFMDVGTPERWLASNLNMLKLEQGTRIIMNRGTIADNCTLIGPVSIGKNCRLTNVTIGPFVSIGDGAELDGCVIEKSVVCENAWLTRPMGKIKRTIVGCFCSDTYGFRFVYHAG
ncbi:sugar phosphate nucleotidyltransferase [Paenibacillus glucanolyticus]|uniref:sugar phosphate nucleotidyltransferase n=1 Tax=Paenibacillus glucanolyticus TaxID=59843 RepID=UPI00096E3CAA|nr:sugar phosphate nucleotidyltransferase [Paenibacillus glucanolyticus]OMF66945.1 hypothetical protein BK142_28755 [Paenibacillus glucanolyticus]